MSVDVVLTGLYCCIHTVMFTVVICCKAPAYKSIYIQRVSTHKNINFVVVVVVVVVVVAFIHHEHQLLLTNWWWWWW